MNERVSFEHEPPGDQLRRRNALEDATGHLRRALTALRAAAIGETSIERIEHLTMVHSATSDLVQLLETIRGVR